MFCLEFSHSDKKTVIPFREAKETFGKPFNCATPVVRKVISRRIFLVIIQDISTCIWQLEVRMPIPNIKPQLLNGSCHHSRTSHILETSMISALLDNTQSNSDWLFNTPLRLI